MNLDLDDFEDVIQGARDLTLSYRDKLSEDPVYPEIDYADVEAAFDEPPPDEGVGGRAILDVVEKKVIPGCTKVGHPRFLAWMNNSSCDAGVVGEMINIGLGQVPFTFKGGKSFTAIERTTGRWFREIFGLPSNGAASFTGGGTLANLTALAVAREAMFPGVAQDGVPTGTPRIYVSEQGHVSIDRAVGLLGLGIRNIVRVATDARFRVDVGQLEAAILKDMDQGLKPFCVVAQAGSAAVGSVDDLHALADICERRGLWLHVDAAYGGAAVLTERGRKILSGIERADSVTTDPHKWFYMPAETGLVLFRREEQALAYFLQSSCPSYRGPMDKINLMNQGLQIAQVSKAFKVWFALKACGFRRIRNCVDKDLDLARAFAAEIGEYEGWEVVNEIDLSTVCVRLRSTSGRLQDDNAIQLRILEDLESSGKALLSSVTIGGQVSIRLCFANHRTQLSDVRILVDALTGIGRALRRGTPD